MLSVFYSDTVGLPLPEKHAFPKCKYRLLRERVERLAERLPIRLAPGRDATRDELLRVHTGEYVERVFAGGLTEKEQRAIGFPWSEGMVRRSLRSVGSTLAAAEAAFAGDAIGWAAHLAGGTHHAFADRGQGYCVFNDVAVAIRALQAEGRIDRALVIDCDVHQGNGTATLFAGDASVFTLSVHGAKNFPREKETSDLDAPLPDGCGDDEYLAALDPALDRAWENGAEGPFGVVFYISGADPFEQDRYGRMRLTKAGLRERDLRVFARCAAAGVPTVVAMGGGYSRDENHIADIHAATIEEAAIAASTARAAG